MDSLQWYDYMRLATALLALVSLYRLGQQARRKFHTYSSRLKDYWWILSAYLTLSGIGALEAAAANGDFRSSSLLNFMIVVVALRATRRSDEPLQHE